VLQDAIHAVEDAEARRDRLTGQIEERLPRWSMAATVAALQALRGVALIAAVTLVAEAGDLSRFDNPRQLMAYLGLVPAERSSAERLRRGAITKAGNGEARRVMVEAAWSYRMPARVSRARLGRMEGLPKPVRDIAWKAELRLCARYRRLTAAGKPAKLVTTAIAREILGHRPARQAAANHLIAPERNQQKGKAPSTISRRRPCLEARPRPGEPSRSL